MNDQIPFLNADKNGPGHFRAPDLRWTGETLLQVEDVRFRLSYDTNELLAADAGAADFLLGKPRHMVERAVDIARRRRIDKMFEMGILHGGSVALYDLVFRPSRIVAIDHSPNPVPALAAYIESRGKADAIHAHYGIDQSNREAMETLLVNEFPRHDIDLVIDDASHLYQQTRAAFNICFPYLAPGGLYVIEDWAWAHWTGDFWQGADSPFAGQTALSNLLIELFMLSASRSDLIDNLFIDHNMVVVRRGEGEIPPGPFDLGEHYLLRGKTFDPAL